VSREGIYPEEGKLAGIKEFPTPRKLKSFKVSLVYATSIENL